MAYYKLIRKYPQGNAVRGRLYLCTHEGETAICNTIENKNYLIPALIYRVTVTQSPRFKRVLPILLQVPGRSGIRFHRGSRPEHSRGCILVTAADEKALTDRWLNEKKTCEETRLEIVDLPQ